MRSVYWCFTGLLLCTACNFADSESKSENEQPVSDTLSINTEKDSLEDLRKQDIINFNKEANKLVQQLKVYEQQLADSLEETSAPAEIQEELLLQYKQLGQQANQALKALEKSLPADTLNDLLMLQLEQARTVTEFIDDLLEETDKLY